MTAPFFSVVIPVYNRAHILRHALDSVLVQDEQDFEIVVVDDGSRDDPKAVIDLLNDPRIRYVRRTNGGGGAARNTGIAEARGEFIAFLDSDDAFLPHHLAQMRALLAGTTNVAGYARIVVDRGGGRTLLKPPRGIAPGEDMARYLLCDRGFVPTITTVVPRELAQQVLYDTDLREAEDTDFAIRLALAGCRFRMAEEPGAVWADHYDPNRQSAGRSTARLAQWLERMKPRMSRAAYLGGRGWAVAKGVALQSRARALHFYLAAVLAGCYRPRLAVVVFLQIFLPDRTYRRLADGVVGRFGMAA
ncbi:MAG: glycosyltransferase family 2 protein [Proteobacteria bacterium]|nr:glycosyltransferase family 2 protein [Pseudomonadota bacterium]